ncbi:uncharacterized protein LOC128962502 [Oppia nitens]|uniref:uncharacterized protein LOC128962502 n=1 Tax=Oppia nitens TaxID=1686743 RepID=UPI0023DA41C8|nr:uncharacterized protein LOC128962502 [Oppia nitens]
MGIPVYRFRVVLMGDTGVGKSCLHWRYTTSAADQRLDTDHQSVTKTNCCHYRVRTLVFHDKLVTMELWDTPGCRRYHQLLMAMYYTRAPAAVMVVYDLTNYSSYQRAVEIVKQLRSGETTTATDTAAVGDGGSSDQVIVLVGNKLDLIETAGSCGSGPTGAADTNTGRWLRAVSRVEALEFAKQYRAVVMETSGKCDINLDDLFAWMANRLADNCGHKTMVTMVCLLLYYY